MPLLAYTLRQLYDRAEPGQAITHADYEAVGGVVAALRRQADTVMRTLAPCHPQHSVLAVLLRLVSVERGGEPVRRRVRREALRADEEEIVQAFVDARLLSSDELDDEVVVEVAHEALLRQWEPLRAAVEASRRTLALRAEIEEDARSWDQAGREDSYLLRGVRLAAAEELSEDYVHDLGVLEQEFLSASRTLAGKELQTARRSNRRLRRLAAGLITFLVLAVTASSLAVVRTIAAEWAEQKARSRQFAAQALALLDSRPDTALLLALEGVRTGGTKESITALQDALNRPYHVATPLTGHEGAVNGVAFSPDGTTLASAGADRTVRLWRLAAASWVPEACRLANRNLSRLEWNEFVGHDTPYVRTCPALPSGQGAPSDAPGAHYEQAIWRTSPT